jgi:microcystin-dependent protein
MSTEPFVGEITIYPYGFAPRGWLYCEGQQLLISQFSMLFSLIGITFGGDGRSTFKLPDLRGRTVIGQGEYAGYTYIRGLHGGRDRVQTTPNNLPSHMHQVDVQYDAALGATNEDGDQAAPGPGNILAKDVDTTGGTHPVMAYAEQSKQNTTLGGLNAASIAQCHATGGGEALEIQNPYIVLAYCIAATGVYPQRH